MMNFMFHSPTEFIFGRDTEQQVGQTAKRYGAHRAMIVYGGGSVKRSGLLTRVETALKASGIEHVELGGITPNPTDTRVYEGIDLARKEQVDFMLAVGGGSVIDTAKAIAAGVKYDGDFWDFFCGKRTVEDALPIGVVLTIPAAGSEGSGNAVITKTDGLHKLSLRTPMWLRPKFAIMNPELTFTLPPYQTACGIADMMVHVMERYFSNTKGCELTDRMCEAVLMAIIDEAPKVMHNPQDYEARANIMWAGTLAHNGICGTGREEDWASHFMEHELSAVYGVTHGAGLTAIVPAWMTWMCRHNINKVEQFARRVMGVTPNDVEGAAPGAKPRLVALEGVRRLARFWQSMDLPTNITQLGIPKPDIDLLVDKLHENKGEFVGNYVKLDREMTREIYVMARDYSIDD
ncbi:MAG: iron-containing alcohol dehydrogenase [Bacteroidaceae bacterium]|nr:iron-containing alcohol dehydrogenase [Bacteroidaceae bacterium]